MKKYLLYLFLSYCPFIHAQYWELGGGIAATNNRTDISNFNIMNTRFGGDAFIRYNFRRHVWVLRADVKYMRISARDSYNSDIISNLRNYSFFKDVGAATFNVEYNFLNFRDLKEKIRFSPYLTVGVGSTFFQIPSNTIGSTLPIHPCIPFGFGVKYMLNKNWNIGAKYEAFKLFTDNLDGINDQNPVRIDPHIRSTDPATNDWIHYVGINISYTIYKIKCPPHLENLMESEMEKRK